MKSSIVSSVSFSLFLHGGNVYKWRKKKNQHTYRTGDGKHTQSDYLPPSLPKKGQFSGYLFAKKKQKITSISTTTVYAHSLVLVYNVQFLFFFFILTSKVLWVIFYLFFWLKIEIESSN
jgi:hypothetical protein